MKIKLIFPYFLAIFLLISVDSFSSEKVNNSDIFKINSEQNKRMDVINNEKNKIKIDFSSGSSDDIFSESEKVCLIYEIKEFIKGTKDTIINFNENINQLKKSINDSNKNVNQKKNVKTGDIALKKFEMKLNKSKKYINMKYLAEIKLRKIGKEAKSIIKQKLDTNGNVIDTITADCKLLSILCNDSILDYLDYEKKNHYFKKSKPEFISYFYKKIHRLVLLFAEGQNRMSSLLNVLKNSISRSILFY